MAWGACWWVALALGATTAVRAVDLALTIEGANLRVTIAKAANAPLAFSAQTTATGTRSNPSHVQFTWWRADGRGDKVRSVVPLSANGNGDGGATPCLLQRLATKRVYNIVVDALQSADDTAGERAGAGQLRSGSSVVTLFNDEVGSEVGRGASDGVRSSHLVGTVLSVRRRVTDCRRASEKESLAVVSDANVTTA